MCSIARGMRRGEGDAALDDPRLRAKAPTSISSTPALKYGPFGSFIARNRIDVASRTCATGSCPARPPGPRAEVDPISAPKSPP